MVARRRSRRRGPSSVFVAWLSLALFAALFVLLTLQLSSQGEGGRAGAVRRPVAIRELPEPEEDEMDDEGEAVVRTAEPEVEAAPPLVTSSS